MGGVASGTPSQCETRPAPSWETVAFTRELSRRVAHCRSGGCVAMCVVDADQVVEVGLGYPDSVVDDVSALCALGP